MEKLMKKMKEMDPEERDRLRRLLKEKGGKKDRGGDKQDKAASAEDSKKLEWMYSEDRPEQEEYLLGRRIDKFVEGNEEKQEDTDAPGALFTDEFLAKRMDLDMQAKMREDPLFMIKRQEEEARKRLLKNPIKMKQLQKMVDEQKVKKKKKKSKQKKKHKKKYSDSSDSSDSDSELINKYLAIVMQKQKTKDDSERQSSSDQDGYLHKTSHGKNVKSERGTRGRLGEDGHRQHRDISREGEQHQHDDRERHRHRDKDGERSQPDGSGGERHRHNDRSEKQHHYNDRREERHQHYDREERHQHSDRDCSRHGQHREAGEERLQMRDRDPDKDRHRRKDKYRDYEESVNKERRSRSPRHRSPPSKAVPERSKKTDKSTKRKLTQDEMDQRRAEMLENANWRDEQREKNVKRYKEESQREDEMLKKQKHTDSADFVKPLMAAHAGDSSIEDRIKRNIYNIQRTPADLDKNFHKR